MKIHSITLLFGVLFAVALFVTPANAQDLGFSEEEIKAVEAKEDKEKDGWYFTVKPSANFTFDDNRNVVGKQDGYSLTFGLKFEADIVLEKGMHEWRTSILLAESLSRSPVIEEFALSNDVFKIESIYLYYFYDWFGVYGRFVLDTEIFEGYDIQATNSVYKIAHLDGTTEQVQGTRKKLTGWFSPLILKQGFGPFFRPLKSEKINLEFLLGMGFVETFVENDLTIKDDDATPEIELKELENVYQIGGESINRVWGELWEKRVSYKAGVELFYSFYNSPDTSGLTGADKLNVELYTRWSFKILEWMSLDYEFKALREPHLSDDWQITNNVLFNFGYNYNAYKAY